MCLPKRGTASDVAGIVSATILRKTVRDNRMVTPETEIGTEMVDNITKKHTKLHTAGSSIITYKLGLGY